MTINMVIVLTKSSGGDEASAVFNAAAGNLLGVIITPTLILIYLGKDSGGGIDLLQVVIKLALRVVLPIFVGQLIQLKFPEYIKPLMKAHKSTIKKGGEFGLTFIVYCVFCKTFNSKEIAGTFTIWPDFISVFIVVGLWLPLLMTVSWFLFRFLYPDDPDLVIFALYGCTQKTMAMGIRLISALYEGSDKLGVYTLPLLIWHPMQMIWGSG